MPETGQTPAPAVPPPSSTPRHRSGAVARMLRMPVATLRVWERRYALTRPSALTPGGQRLYSADDVRRLALLKQLTERGHAVGSLASLDMAALQQVAATHAQALTAAPSARAAPARAAAPAAPRALRLVVIGKSLGARLQRPALLQRLGRPVELLGVFDEARPAEAALHDQPVDSVLWQVPALLAGWHATVQDEAPRLSRAHQAVFYGLAAEGVCEALADAGVALLREPQPDAVLAQWIGGIMRGTGAADATDPSAARADGDEPPPRHWSDEALAAFAGLSTTVACACPRHVAELLAQLSRFEAYSAGCAHRHAADAALHAFLGRVAAEARSRFETALERVALHEGLLLPPGAR